MVNSERKIFLMGQLQLPALPSSISLCMKEPRGQTALESGLEIPAGFVSRIRSISYCKEIGVLRLLIILNRALYLEC